MTADLNGYPRREIEGFVPGEKRTGSFIVSRDQLAHFVEGSEDRHPLHTSPEHAGDRGHKDVVVHGMLVVSRSSAFIAREFVGSHGLLVAMTCDFRQPVYCDEEMVWTGEVSGVSEKAGTVELEWRVTNKAGGIIQLGTACVWLPRDR